MIRYALQCEAGHAFEGWFRSSSDFDEQRTQGRLTCPVCGVAEVEKQIMAPNVSACDADSEVTLPATTAAPETSPTQLMMPDPRDLAMRQMLKSMRDHVLANSVDVGDRFAEEARKIHHEEVERRSIRGRATSEEAQALRDEGIEFSPLPVLPEDQN